MLNQMVGFIFFKIKFNDLFTEKTRFYLNGLDHLYASSTIEFQEFVGGLGCNGFEKGSWLIKGHGLFGGNFELWNFLCLEILKIKGEYRKKEHLMIFLFVEIE